MLSALHHSLPIVVLRYRSHCDRQSCGWRSTVTETVKRNHQVRRINCSRITSEFSTRSEMVFRHSVKRMVRLIGGLLRFGAIVFLSLPFRHTWLVRLLQKVQPDVFFLKRTAAKVIALTIDDSPHPEITPQILDVLKENNCKATFFVIGENLDKCPDLVERMHAEGHEVANHTMQDVASWRLSPEAFRDQLMAVDSRIFTKDVPVGFIKWFRPGCGFYTRWMLAIAEAEGYKVALGSLYPLDTLFTAQARCISKYLLRQMHGGAIVVLHDRQPQRDQTVQVLRTVLPELKMRGYRFETLTILYLLQESQR